MMEMLLPVSMVILHWVPPTAPSTTSPSQGLKEDPVLYTLFTFVGMGGACVLLFSDEDVAGHGVTAGLDGMATGFAGSPPPCLQSRRMWPNW